MAKVVAIDPPGCGCVECMIGMYVPLDQASEKQVLKMLAGKIRNNTSMSFTITGAWCDRSWYFPES